MSEPMLCRTNVATASSAVASGAIVQTLAPLRSRISCKRIGETSYFADLGVDVRRQAPRGRQAHLSHHSRFLRRVGKDSRDLLLDLGATALRTLHGGMPVVLSKRLVRREPLSTLAALEFVGCHPFLLLFVRIDPRV